MNIVVVYCPSSTEDKREILVKRNDLDRTVALCLKADYQRMLLKDHKDQETYELAMPGPCCSICPLYSGKFEDIGTGIFSK